MTTRRRDRDAKKPPVDDDGDEVTGDATGWEGILAEELALAARVREALAAAPKASGRAARQREDALALRQAARESGEEDRAAAVGELHLQRAQEALVGQARGPDPAAPYFGHLRVFTGRRQRDVLLGEVAFVDPRRGVTLVDWRGGLMARVFFQYGEGEDYAEEDETREVEGVVEARRLLTFRDGALVAIETRAGRWAQDPAGRWQPDPAGPPRAQLGTGVGSALREADPIRLDATQRRAVALPPGRPLLVLGDAGCGKTTVALHRLAALMEAGQAPKPDLQALVVVPERGLARLTARWLAALGHPLIPVAVYDDWVVARTRRLVPGLPRRLCRDAPAAVVRLKRHPALWQAIPRYVAHLGAELAAGLDRTLATGDHVQTLLSAQEGPSLRDRFAAVEVALTRAVPDLPTPARKAAFEEVRHRLGRPLEDLPLLVGDREGLEAAVAASAGQLTPGMVLATLRHLRDQLADPAEVEFADVAAERRTALDGRGLDEGTPAELAGTIDLEDCALLLALRRELLGPPPKPQRALRALVVDEAQDLAAVELAALADACARDCAVSVAGDPAQQIDPTLGFGGWDDALAALGLRRAEEVSLEISYRCPAPVTRLAQAVRPGGSTAAPPAGRPGDAPVVRTWVPTAGHRAALLVETLGALVDREPYAQIAVLARTPQTARDCHAALAAALDARLVLDGAFTFTPGIDVTTVSEVKGLEFDYVVVPDVGAATYPATPEAARQLYVALTRTSAQAWLLHRGPPSPLLPAG